MRLPVLVCAASSLALLAVGHPPRDAAGPIAVDVRQAGRLPMRFEPNLGQFDEPVRFLARSRGATLFLTDDGATLRLRAPAHGTPPRAAERRVDPPALPPPDAVLGLKVAGARPTEPRAEGRLATVTNYFLGNDPARWR